MRELIFFVCSVAIPAAIFGLVVAARRWRKAMGEIDRLTGRDDGESM